MSRTLRILHISNPVSIPSDYGGTERFIYALAIKQVKHNHEVFIIAGKPSRIPNVRDLSFAKGEHYREKVFIPKRISTLYALRAFLRSRKYEIDIIHNHMSEEAIPYSIFSRVPVITTLHCPLALRGTPFFFASLAKLLPKKTKFVAISRKSYEAYKPFYGKRLLTYIHHCIDVSNYPFKNRIERSHEIQICSVGKFLPIKNHHLAIRVADFLKRKGYDVILFLVGKADFPPSPYLKGIIFEVKKRPYVKLVLNPSTKQLNDIVSNCDSLIWLSNEIGLGIIQLEALAMGTPIVGLRSTTAEEIVHNGYNGYIAVNLKDVAEKAILAKELNRNNCREYVEEHFSPKIVYERHMKVYDQVLQDEYKS